MTRTLAGRVAVVTGVTAGIGRVVARDLLDAGAAVVGCARDGKRLGLVEAELPGLVAVPCDLRESAERAALVHRALDRFARVDVLVHNAGLGYVGAVADMTADDVERIIDTNVTALIDLTRLVLPGMQRRGDGDVLVVSSIAAWVQLPPLTAYAASKRAVDGFVEGLRREVPHGIRVHSVNPGFVSTEFHARALGMRPREHDPGVRRLPGTAPEVVSVRVLRELRRGRGRTVAVPRVLGLARLVGLPGFSHALDLAVRSVPAARLGRAFAERRAPGACHDDDHRQTTGEQRE
jgi:NAD(P)-dependent dehydrogenase (short-subunit alcohol dehydrogenase family)